MYIYVCKRSRISIYSSIYLVGFCSLSLFVCLSFDVIFDTALFFAYIVAFPANQFSSLKIHIHSIHCQILYFKCSIMFLLCFYPIFVYVYTYTHIHIPTYIYFLVVCSDDGSSCCCCCCCRPTHSLLNVVMLWSQLYIHWSQSNGIHPFPIYTLGIHSIADCILLHCCTLSSYLTMYVNVYLNA